jgi:hypothetical protein
LNDAVPAGFGATQVASEMVAGWWWCTISRVVAGSACDCRRCLAIPAFRRNPKPGKMYSWGAALCTRRVQAAGTPVILHFFGYPDNKVSLPENYAWLPRKIKPDD